MAHYTISFFTHRCASEAIKDRRSERPIRVVRLYGYNPPASFGAVYIYCRRRGGVTVFAQVLCFLRYIRVWKSPIEQWLFIEKSHTEQYWKDAQWTHETEITNPLIRAHGSRLGHTVLIETLFDNTKTQLKVDGKCYHTSWRTRE